MTAAAPDREPALAWARWELPALLITLLLGLALRLTDYANAPDIADNGDELDWTWQGLGLITRGSPYGWSNIHLYPNPSRLVTNGNLFEVVHPYLDHPPVFGLMAGFLAWLQGARQLTDVTAGMIRPLPIGCAVVSLALAYLLGRRVMGPAPALVGVALIATAPAAVLMQRQVEAEALLAPMMIGALLLASMATSGQPRRIVVAGLLALCFLAPLVKVSGVAVAAVITLLLLAAGQWKLALAALAAGLAGMGGFFIYGALFDWNLFLKVVAASDARRYGILGVYQFIAAPAGPEGANQHLRDGWWLLGWLGLASVLAFQRDRRLDLISWPIVGYAVVIMLFAEHISYYGWFRIAVYPLIYLLAGWMAWRSVQEPSPIGILLVLTVATFPVLSALFGDHSKEAWAPSPYLLIALMAILAGPALLVTWSRAPRWAVPVARYAAIAGLGVALFANVATSLNLTALYRYL